MTIVEGGECAPCVLHARDSIKIMHAVGLNQTMDGKIKEYSKRYPEMFRRKPHNQVQRLLCGCQPFAGEVSKHHRNSRGDREELPPNLHHLNSMIL